MKKTIAILIALMMVLSSVSFALPVAVSTVTTVDEAEESTQNTIIPILQQEQVTW